MLLHLALYLCSGRWVYFTLFGRFNQSFPKDHPLRPIRQLVDTALLALEEDFDALYAEAGRDSIPPEKLLRAQLLMVFYTIRSERQLMEQLDYNLLFRWFVGFSIEDPVWHHSTFTKNRDRLLEGDIARQFFAQVLAQADQAHSLPAMESEAKAGRPQ